MAKTTNETSNNMKKSPNKWQIAFITLLAILIGGMTFLFVQVSGEREPSLTSQKEVALPVKPSFSLQLEKEQVNEIISFYLNDFLKDTGVKYRFYLENQALLNGTFDILGYDLQFYLYFEPYVMENGDIQLKAKSLSLGKLPLPIKQVMTFAKKKFTIPEWVSVSPDDEIIMLHLSQFTMQNQMKIRAEKINLIDDDIRFNVYLPTTKEEGN